MNMIQEITPEEAEELTQLALDPSVGEWVDSYDPDIHGTLAEWSAKCQREEELLQAPILTIEVPNRVLNLIEDIGDDYDLDSGIAISECLYDSYDYAS